MMLISQVTSIPFAMQMISVRIVNAARPSLLVERSVVAFVAEKQGAAISKSPFWLVGGLETAAP